MADNFQLSEGVGKAAGGDEVTDATLGTVTVQYVKEMDGTLDSTNKALVTSGGARAVALATDAITSAGVALTPKRAFANVSASQTDSSIVAAVASKSIRVLAASIVCGGTATNITFNSKPAGAGTAISPLFANAANGGAVLPFNPVGWFQSASGEGLTVTTSAGSATGVLVTYVEV